MKIALVGTCSSGKTTTLSYCREQFGENPDIIFVEEVARQFFTETPEARKWKQLKTQTEIAERLIASEQGALSNSKIALCDSSVFEACAYTRTLDDEEAFEKIKTHLEHWFPTYDLLLLSDPTDIPLENDGLRTETEDIRMLVHEHLERLLEETNTPYTLLTGPKHLRLKTVSDLLTRHLTT